MTIWQLALAMALVVAVVVTILLAVILSIGRRIQGVAQEIWIVGQREPIQRTFTRNDNVNEVYQLLSKAVLAE